jgi:hypothetical protein
MNARFFRVAISLFSLFLSSGISAVMPAPPAKSVNRPSKAAAERCNAKLKSLEDFAADRKAGRKQTTQFSQDEINAYLALDLSPQYHPCLKSLVITLEENALQAVAVIDFDRLGKTSTNVMPKFISFLFSGAHSMTAKGQLVSGKGSAHFQLDQAQFDGLTLPNALVEEIISAVGMRQNHPFDPLQPSKLLYEIEKVNVHPGYIIAYQ